MANNPLPQAPQGFPCWGLEFSSSDHECRNCYYQSSCRDQFIGRSSMSVPPPPSPVAMVPAPPPPPPPPMTNWRAPAPPAPVPPPPQAPSYQGWQPTQWAVPTPAPQWQSVPQQWQPQYQWEQVIGKYPNESTAERVGKNTLLRMAEAAFAELTRFFHYFTWPKEVR